MNHGSSISWLGFLKTLLLSYAVTIVLMFILAFLMYQMKWGASQASMGIIAIYVLSCALGGFLTGRRMGTRRLLWGLLSGVLYFAVLFLLSVCFGDGIHGGFKDVGTVLAACLGGSALGAFLS